MDNTTILAIAVLAAVLVYFLILRKPNPPSPPPNPPHPVEDRCVINYLNILGPFKKGISEMHSFYTNFIKKNGLSTIDPILTSISTLDDTSFGGRDARCLSFDPGFKGGYQFVIKSLIKIGYTPYGNATLMVLFNGQHHEDLLTYYAYLDFLKHTSDLMTAYSLKCCQ